MVLAIDCTLGMPLPWTVGEGPYVVLLSLVILWLTGRERFPALGGHGLSSGVSTTDVNDD